MGGIASNGVPFELDENRLKNEKERPSKALQGMQGTIDQKKVQRSSGEHEQFSKEDLLQSGMYGKGDDSQKPFVWNYSKEKYKTQKEILQQLRWKGSTAIAPYRRKLEEQQSWESDDFVRLLSCQTTLEEWQETTETTIGLQGLRTSCSQAGYVPKTLSEVFEIWRSITYEEKQWWVICACKGNPFASEPPIPRVATGIKDRVNRLKGLGNAVVPMVPYQIFKAIQQYEDNH